VNHVHL
jgi:hypothetical protein